MFIFFCPKLCVLETLRRQETLRWTTFKDFSLNLIVHLIFVDTSGCLQKLRFIYTVNLTLLITTVSAVNTDKRVFLWNNYRLPPSLIIIN